MLSFILLIGDRDYTKEENTEQEIKVINIVQHPKYDSEAEDMDFALLELETPADLTSSSVQTINLPRRRFRRNTFIGRQCFVTGWGADSVTVTDPEEGEAEKTYPTVSGKSVISKPQFVFKFYGHIYTQVS